MINKMVLQGRLTAAPECKQTQSGVPVASFTVAWSEKYKEIETKCFLRCVAWRGTAEFVSKYFAKGQEIAVEGKLTTREWDDDNGQKRSVIELVVNQAHFCGSKSQNQGTGSAGAAPARTGSAGTSPYSPDASADAPQFEVLGEGDELPF